MIKISVIIPLFRGKKYIGVLIDILRRNKGNYEKRYAERIDVEAIFVNDYPNEEINFFCTGEISCKVINHKINKGIHSTRIDGYICSTGDFLLFLDQDDYIGDDFFSTQIDCLNRYNADWVICNGIYRTSRIIYRDERDVNNILDEAHYFSSLTEIVSPGQVIIKRTIIPKEWYTMVLKGNYCDDAFLWILLKSKGVKLAYNNNIAYIHRENNDNTSFSWDKNASALKELKNVLNKNHIIKDEYLVAFNNTVDKEIRKQDLYGFLENKYSFLLKTNVKSSFISFLGEGKVLIYGYGIWGRKLYYLLNANGIEVDGVYDKNLSGDVDGVYVRGLEELHEKMTNNKNTNVIITVLMDMNVLTEFDKYDNVMAITILDLFDALLEERS